jgi:arginine-tRNA-protein transferase
VSYTKAEYSDEYFNLYTRYLAARHTDGGMDNPDPEDFKRFLLNPWGEVLFVTASLDNQVVAVAVTDATPEGLSAVYTFFDPEQSDRGLGRYCILQQIELCRSKIIPYLYLGYWVDGCQKMQYKTDYQPQEHFDGQQWVAE